MRPRSSEGVLNCSTVVPMEMKPVKPTPVKNRRASDSKYIGESANSSRAIPKRMIIPNRSQFLRPGVSQRRQEYVARERADSGNGQKESGAVGIQIHCFLAEGRKHLYVGRAEEPEGKTQSDHRVRDRGRCHKSNAVPEVPGDTRVALCLARLYTID